MLEKVAGVVIRTQDYQETNKIITIFSSKLGKFSALARGANKPKSRMSALSQPFIQGDYLVYVNKGLSTIQQGEVIHSFRKIREDIVKTAYASYVTELTNKLLDDKTPDVFIYEQFLQTLQWIETSDSFHIPILMYELKLYEKAGFAPVVHACVNCQQSSDHYSFSIKEGGLLCLTCVSLDEHATPLTETLAKLLYVFQNVGLERIGNISVSEENMKLYRRLFDQYYDTYGHYQLKTRRFIKQLDAFE
ncbi:MAG TPA: DNA repair protein RecO [Bacillota bacterium]|nr:DNA repair protein RecO [Bacillota bacterium]